MKHTQLFKILFFFLAIVVISNYSIGQTAKEIFTSSELSITYLGIDFTEARLIGDAGADEIEIKKRYFPSINQVVVNEPKKYELGKAFNKSNLATDLSFVEKINEKVDASKIKSSASADFNRLNTASIEKVVKQYNFAGKKGVGILFIMEGMSKSEQQGSMYVTFINMVNNKVLFTERMVGKSGGFGFRNYWLKPVYEVLKDIEKFKYDDWKKKY